MAMRDDLVQPFTIGETRLKGRLVRVGPLLDHILGQHAYPEPVAEMLGQAIVLAAALARALKYDGIFTLQTKGDGPVRLLVADITAKGQMRAYAQFDDERLRSASPAKGAVPSLLGAGYLAFTVDQGEDTERYQGLVELVGSTLTDCAHHYFRQSEQVQAGLKLAARRGADGHWRGGALMIERLPDAAATPEEDDELWREAVVLMSSCSDSELTDAGLAPDRLLYRLFQEPGVRAQKPRELIAQCRCSRARVERVLRALPSDALDEMVVDGRIIVTCEFCSATYEFDEGDRKALAE
ncbi:MAG: Hsp33 family molecular chaperone HslO [Stellaceae bacterium]